MAQGPNYVWSRQYGLLRTTGRPEGYGRAVRTEVVIIQAAGRALARMVREQGA